MRWRAWYDDGSVYTSTDTPWQDLPSEGIVGVVVYLSEVVTPFRRIVDGCDWYYLKDGRIECVESHPEWGKWVEPPFVPCLPCLKRSGAMTDEVFAVVQRDMQAAKDAP